MLLLPSIPASPTELAQSVQLALAAFAPGSLVTAKGAAFDALSSFEVDLTGVKSLVAFKPEPVRNDAGWLIRTESFVLRGQPYEYLGFPLSLDIEAHNAAFELRATHAGGVALVPAGATTATLRISITQAAAQAGLQSIANAKAHELGAQIEQVRLQWSTEENGTVKINAAAQAKLFIMSADGSLSFELRLLHDHRLQVSQIRLDGPSMIQSLLSAKTAPTIARIEGHAYALTDFLPPKMQVASASIIAGESLTITASLRGSLV